MGGQVTCNLRRTKKWAEPESNRRHMDFQSIALPTELPARQSGVAFYSGRAALQAWRATGALTGGREAKAFAGEGTGGTQSRYCGGSMRITSVFTPRSTSKTTASFLLLLRKSW